MSPTVPAEAAAPTEDRAITLAKKLEQERAALMDRIGKNRAYLRLKDANGELSDKDGQWLDTFYPLKEKGERRSKEDIVATREAKKAARS